MRLIAEVKKASPSKGVIREDFDPVTIAREYVAGGAAALSVLTDEHFFQGSIRYLRDIRQQVQIPILRKEFIIDEYQVIEARVAGADAILLIAECLTPEKMTALYRLASSLDMGVLIELYDPANLEAVLKTECPLVGVNNRDLHTFEVDLHHTIRLRKQIPNDRAVVGESGISNNDDVRLLYESDVQAILVGESLMRQRDITKATKRLLGAVG